jgi:hypothetical protein
MHLFNDKSNLNSNTLCLDCIDAAIREISLLDTKEFPDTPLAHLFYESMVATVLQFPSPHPNHSAIPQLDDLKRIMERRILFDEPRMEAIISSLPECNPTGLEIDRSSTHARLPFFPPHFRILDPAAQHHLSVSGQYLH